MRCAKGLAAVALGICLVGLVSCSVITPADRIRENPAMYQNLPSEQQTLVQQGRICNGMNQDAVFLAWGCPMTDRSWDRPERLILRSGCIPECAR